MPEEVARVDGVNGVWVVRSVVLGDQETVCVTNEIVNVTVTLSERKFPTAAAVALTAQLPAAANVSTAVEELTEQLVVPAFTTAYVIAPPP